MRGITREAIWLSNASTSNAWWRDLANRGIVCHAGCLSFGRVVDDKVIYPRWRSQYESSIIYLGDQRQSFIEEFYEVGWVAEGVVYYSDD
jgi:hypothetical protein